MLALPMYIFVEFDDGLGVCLRRLKCIGSLCPIGDHQFKGHDRIEMVVLILMSYQNPPCFKESIRERN